MMPLNTLKSYHMKLSAKELLQSVEKDLQLQKQNVEEVLRHYPEEVLYFKPTPEKWNVLECLEHLNLTYDYYLPQIKKGIANGQQCSPQEYFHTGWFGNMMTNGMQPKPSGQIGMKTKTFQKTRPQLKEGEKDKVINTFLNNHNTFLSFVEKGKSLNLEKIKVVSLIGPILKFKLGDAFRFLTAHNNRHFQQIENILEQAKKSSKYPSFS